MTGSSGGITVAIVASAIAFIIADSYAACLLEMSGQPIENLTAAVSALPAFVASHGPVSTDSAALATGLLGACAVWIGWAYAISHGKPERVGEEHGSARWGNLREGRKFMDGRDFANNIIFTKSYGLAMSRPDHDRRYERNRNVLVVGGSGSGKTRGYFEPNVMQMNANYLVTDPKGESLPRLGHMPASPSLSSPISS